MSLAAEMRVLCDQIIASRHRRQELLRRLGNEKHERSQAVSGMLAGRCAIRHTQGQADRSGRQRAHAALKSAMAQSLGASRQRRKAEHTAWTDRMKDFHHALKAHRLAIRNASAAIRQQGQQLVSDFAQERRERNVPGQMADWRQVRLEQAARIWGLRRQDRLARASTIAGTLQGWRTDRAQAATALAALHRTQK